MRTLVRIAVVGLSPQWHRPSFFAAKSMQGHGYRIVPTNPGATGMLGERRYPGMPAAAVVNELLPEEVAERKRLWGANCKRAGRAGEVLLVEDLPQLQGVVLDLLATAGDFELAKAVATEAEANLWIDENAGAWDLAVVDLILEQGTSLGVVARARNRPPESKVMMFSDCAAEGTRMHCLKLGADAALQKSQDLHVLPLPIAARWRIRRAAASRYPATMRA